MLLLLVLVLLEVAEVVVIWKASAQHHDISQYPAVEEVELVILILLEVEVFVALVELVT